MGFGRDKEDLIIRFNDRLAQWNDGAIMSVHCGDPSINHRQVFAQIPQFVANQRATKVGTDSNQLNSSAGELNYLQCTRVFDQGQNLLCNDLFRTDNEINRNGFITENLGMCEIFSRTNASNFFGRSVEGVSDLAGCHIDLVLIRDGQEQICIFNSCLLEDAGMRAVSDDRTDIESVLQTL